MPECLSCHRKISGTARFCPFCGAELQAGKEEPDNAENRAARGAASPPFPPGTAAAETATVANQPKVPQGKRTGMVVGILIGAIGLLVLGAVIGLGIGSGVHFLRGPLDTTNAYIRAVNNGDAATAYNLLAPEASQRRDRSLEEFNQAVVQPADNRLRSWRTSGVDFPNGTSHASVTVTESFRTGESGDFRFLIRKVDSRWLITDYFAL